MSRMNPAKQARKTATYRKTRGQPDEAREITGYVPPLVPLRGCRAHWDGEPFPVTVTRISSDKENTDD